MSLITLENVVVEFPLYGTGTRSIKKVIARAATGGIMARDSSEHIIVKALDNINLEAHEGDRIGLVGHNGSGKSTLLRVLAGIYEPSQGTVHVEGRTVSLLSISLGMNEETTGLENIYMRGRVMGLPIKKIKSMVDDIVDFAGIGDYLHLPLKTYSSGMAMRLAYAISTSSDADIILMDEWLSVGDDEFVEKAKSRLNRMLSEARIAVIVSHNSELITSLCNRTVVLDHGKIIQNNVLGNAT